MVSEVGLIIVMAGHGSMLADVVLEKELRVPHLQLQATGSELRHWAWLRQSLPHSDTGLPKRPYLVQPPNSATPLHELTFKLPQLGCLYVYRVQTLSYTQLTMPTNSRV